MFTDLDRISILERMRLADDLAIDFDRAVCIQGLDGKVFTATADAGMPGCNGKTVDRNRAIRLPPDQTVCILQRKNLEFAVLE